MIYVYAIIALALIITVGPLLSRLQRTIGVDCVLCGGRSFNLDNLPEADRQQVLSYFKNAESRMPFSDNVYVCRDCHRVNDESITRNHALGLTVVCKGCGHTTTLDDRMQCRNCGVKLEWVTFSECGPYRFLLPIKTKDANKPDAGKEPPLIRNVSL